ncbi:MAG: DUF1801 domain-containing protein [Putridiphycobacter sp.]|nr:DUF1801 domain-containing protein [Putridiphycobacter sp.]
MQSKATSIEEYFENLPADRKAPMMQLHQTIVENLGEGIEPRMSYGMIGYVIPHSVYPDGYHCDTKLPLPFMNIASQKNFIALYHMGLYADKDLLKWFEAAYPKYVKTKLDMGKSCIRFKKVDQIPFELIGQLVTKMGAEEWIDLYEKQIKKK